ncbi:3'-5' exonuclease [Bacillus sp. 31A1R]|uniref:3'-5' exonuclease n=1 Tax=Robertmurraya mangrovi TaxID=3098077 RepID=A0ABU5J381_9BACI|nr:3'-5' exonuclease [Bacillus sp. 31A1R]MDZ5473868.1 3'-5' exonuclease [Bacillus sp. 31A1R]
MADVMQFVFFDFEMLCSNRGMPFEEMEGIRLGAVKYNLETEEVSFFDQYIQPLNKKPLSSFCKKLTGIIDEDLADAQNYKEVFADFLTWVGGVKRSRFFSWSKSDLTRLQLDSKLHDVPLTTIKKIEKRYVDFQGLFTKRVTKNNFSVENALKLYGKEFIGEKHNPMYDAYNTLIIYLCFSKEDVASDLIMTKQYILDEVPTDFTLMNAKIREHFLYDINEYILEIKEMYKLKDGSKLLKRTQRLVEKYENILINRSGIFSRQLELYVRQLVEFYHELILSYEEHVLYSSKILVLDEHLIYRIGSFPKLRLGNK